MAQGPTRNGGFKGSYSSDRGVHNAVAGVPCTSPTMTAWPSSSPSVGLVMLPDRVLYTVAGQEPALLPVRMLTGTTAVVEVPMPAAAAATSAAITISASSESVASRGTCAATWMRKGTSVIPE